MTRIIENTFIKKFTPTQAIQLTPQVSSVTGDWCVVLWSNCFAWLQFDGRTKVVGKPGILYRRPFRQLGVAYPAVSPPMQTNFDAASAPSVWVYGGDGECPDFLGDFDLWGDELYTLSTGALGNNQISLIASTDGQREIRISCPLTNTGPLMVGRGSYFHSQSVGEYIQPGTTTVVKTTGDVTLANNSGAIQAFTVSVLAMQLPSGS